MTTLIALLLCCLAHPFHRSLAEVQWNDQSQRYEVAFRVDPRDLDAELSLQQKRPIRLDQLERPAADALLKEYVAKHVRLHQGEDNQAQLHWVGHEGDERGKYVWLYFEWTKPAGEAPLQMENRAFTRAEPTHISTVVFTDQAERPALVFTKQTPVHPVPEGLLPANN